VTNMQRIDIPVNKVWVDVPNTDHDPVTVQLGYWDWDNWEFVPIEGKTLVLGPGPDNDPAWSGVFTDLPCCDEDGEPIEYCLEEIFYGDDYDSDVARNEDGSFTITNELKKGCRQITVNKYWSRNTPDSKKVGVTVRLLADGEPINNSNAVAVLNAENGWSHTFGKKCEESQPQYLTIVLNCERPLYLPWYREENGEMIEIEYTVKEDPITRFTAKYDGFNITNTYNPPHRDDPPEDPEEPEPPVIIIPEPEPPTDEIPDIDVPLDESPKTGDQRNLALPMALTMISVAAFFTMKRLVKDQVK